MDEREKRKKILFTILGIIVLILLFFWIKSCSGGSDTKKTTKDITSIDLKTETITLSVGEGDKLPFVVIPSNADETTKWISSDNSVVSVDARGNIEALKAGNAIVSLVSESGVSDYTVVKVVSKETVDGKTVTVGLKENDVSIKVGTTKKMLFDIEPIDTPYNEVLWESSNNLVASITSDGIVSGLRSGVTTITLKVILNDNSTITDSATLTIEENATLYLTSNINEIKEGEVVRAVVALSDASISIVDGNVKSVSDKTATIPNVTPEANYLTFDIKGIKKGNTTLKVSATTSEGKDLSLDIPIVVIGYNDLLISSGDKELKVGEKFNLSGRMDPTVSGSLATTCTSSSSKVAVVSFVEPTGEYNGSCEITGMKKGTATITMNIGGKKKTIKVTVVEEELPGVPINPTTGTDVTNPETITFGTLTSIEATLSKTEYQRNEAMGTLTVSAVYGNGEKKELTPTDYVMINDFDSSTLGNKTLNIAYTDGDVTQVTSVSYVISGSASSSGGTSGRVYSGTGGYSGGGGSSGGSKGDTIKYAITDLKLSTDTLPMANGSYKGSIGVEAQVTGEFGIGTHWIGIAIQCKDGSTDCTPDSKDFIQATVFELEYDEKGKIIGDLPSTIDAGKTAIYVGGSWESKEKLREDGTIDENYTTTSSSKANLIIANTVFEVDENGELSKKPFGELQHISITTEAGTGKNTEVITNCGTLLLTPDKNWYRASGETAKITIRATGTNGCYLQSLVIGDKGKTENFMNGTISATRYESFYTQNQKSLTVTATFVTNGGYACPEVSKTIDLKIDDIKPNCTAIVSTNKNYVTVTGWDTAPGSGIGTITGAGLSKYETKNSQQYTKTLSFPIVEAKNYSFTVKDVAGNQNYCGVTVEKYDCYKESRCGAENGSAKACLACKEAGCDNEITDSVHRYYNCKSSDGDDIYLWLEASGTLLENIKTTSKNLFAFEVYDYKYENKKYDCKLQEDVDGFCAKKGTISGMITKTEFRKNCQLCGCDTWSSFDINWKRLDGIETEPISTSDSITAFNTAKSKYADCRSIESSTESGWNCGEGAGLGPKAPKQCK